MSISVSEREAAMQVLRDRPLAASGAGIFSINFLRETILPLRIRRIVTLSVIGFLAANVVALIALIATALVSSREAAHLAQGFPAHQDSMAATREMQALYQRAVADLAQLKTAGGLDQQRFLIGGHLAVITRTLPARTWVTQLTGSREERKLTIQALYLIDPDKPYELPTKGWIDALKADPQFAQGLSRLDLGNSSRKTQGEAELFSFELIAQWNS